VRSLKKFMDDKYYKEIEKKYEALQKKIGDITAGNLKIIDDQIANWEIEDWKKREARLIAEAAAALHKSKVKFINGLRDALFGFDKGLNGISHTTTENAFVSHIRKKSWHDVKRDPTINNLREISRAFFVENEKTAFKKELDSVIEAFIKGLEGVSHTMMLSGMEANVIKLAEKQNWPSADLKDAFCAWIRAKPWHALKRDPTIDGLVLISNEFRKI